jgi:hypothetical protein
MPSSPGDGVYLATRPAQTFAGEPSFSVLYNISIFSALIL